MKIYTRTGDAGMTGLLGGSRVAKDDLRISAYGALDELNAQLGVVRAAPAPADIDAELALLQHEMFSLGSELSSPEAAPRGVTLVGDAELARLEAAIDRFEPQLPPLRNFILPGGAPAAAALHVARCVCRRAEREIVTLAHESAVRPDALAYINRVSDLLFVLARATNAAAGIADVPWQKHN